MPSNAPAMRKAGPITSAGWPRLQPGATRARTPGTAALAGSECLGLTPDEPTPRGAPGPLGQHHVERARVDLRDQLGAAAELNLQHTSDAAGRNGRARGQRVARVLRRNSTRPPQTQGA